MRKFRIAVALTVFCLVSAKFFDVYSALPKSYYMYFNPISTQFAPSLLKMMAYASLTAGAAFVTFTLLALLFGRAYCSFFCLFGILMDIIRKAAVIPAKIGFLKKTKARKILPKKFRNAEICKGKKHRKSIVSGQSPQYRLFSDTRRFSGLSSRIRYTAK